MLGRGLHAFQDVLAHGSLGADSDIGEVCHHNSTSPQKDYGKPGLYPDNPLLDAHINGKIAPHHGIPDGKTVHRTNPNMKPSHVYVRATYALFMRGSFRITATKKITEDKLSAFISFLYTSNSSDECKCYFFS